MKLSNEYLALKAQAKEGEEFIATLTQALATDILSRSLKLRPPHPGWIKKFSDIFVTGSYDPNKEDSDPIIILLESDSLFNGIQRLNGFIKSKKESVQMKFLFSENEEEVMKYLKLRWTPQTAMAWLRIEKEVTANLSKLKPISQFSPNDALDILNLKPIDFNLLSNKLVQIKKQALNKKGMAMVDITLDKELAQELLNLPNRRPETISEDHFWLWAFLYYSKTAKGWMDNESVIFIDKYTNERLNGVHRLTGFLYSGIKQIRTTIAFVDGEFML